LLFLQQPISARERALVTEADAGLARAVLLPEGGLHLQGTVFSPDLRARVWVDAVLQRSER
jgi:hypothetical protein